jgi:hypothetical protein
MKRRLVYGSILLLVVAAALIALAWPREEFIASRSAADHAATEANIARGAYLARAGDCMACHTARGGVPYAAAAHSTRLSGACSRPTSRRSRRPASATGRQTISGAPCTTASRRMAACCIRPSPTRTTRR